jgi:hypothetical protein
MGNGIQGQNSYTVYYNILMLKKRVGSEGKPTIYVQSEDPVLLYRPLLLFLGVVKFNPTFTKSNPIITKSNPHFVIRSVCAGIKIVTRR